MEDRKDQNTDDWEIDEDKWNDHLGDQGSEELLLNGFVDLRVVDTLHFVVDEVDGQDYHGHGNALKKWIVSL